jgi:hypothetical protein
MELKTQNLRRFYYQSQSTQHTHTKTKQAGGDDRNDIDSASVSATHTQQTGVL